MKDSRYERIARALDLLSMYYYDRIEHSDDDFSKWISLEQLGVSFRKICNNKPAARAWGLKARRVIAAL